MVEASGARAEGATYVPGRLPWRAPSAEFQEEPIQPWREAELMVLHYSAGEGKEIGLRKFVNAAAHCTV